MFDFTVLECLQEQYLKQDDTIQHTIGFDKNKLKAYKQQTHDLIERMYHLQYDEKTGKWKPTRKPRQRPLRDGAVVEMWVVHSETKDHLCLRFEGEMYNQGEGPRPVEDSHPHCRCRREVVAIPSDKGGLKWAVPKPRNKRKPKIKVPKEYREPASPYDVDSIRAPDAVFA